MRIKNQKNKWRRALALLAAPTACSLLFPQMLFSGCVGKTGKLSDGRRVCQSFSIR